MIDQRLMDEARELLEHIREVETALLVGGLKKGDPTVFRKLMVNRDDARALAKVTGGKLSTIVSGLSPDSWIVEWTDREPYRRASRILFMQKHGLTDEEIETDHWQTLFALEHPEARG